MQKKSIYLLLFLFTTFITSTQNVLAQESIPVLKKPVFLHTSFYYDMPNSFGASAGIDLTLKSKTKFKRNNSGNETASNRDLILNTDIGFYHYRFNNTGIFIIPSIGKRYYKSGPHYFELLMGAGMVRTFYDGIVYTVDDNGKVNEKSYFGRYYATANISTTFGWDFEKSKKPKPFALQVKPVLWFQFPYNSFLLPHLAIEAGFKYHFKNFNTNVIQKKLFVK